MIPNIGLFDGENDDGGPSETGRTAGILAGKILYKAMKHLGFAVWWILYVDVFI